MAYHGDKETPGDFSLNPEGEWDWDYDVGDPWWYRDGECEVSTVSDFYVMFWASTVTEEMVEADFGAASFFVVCGPGTDAEVRFSQAVDPYSDYLGYYDWQTPATMHIGEGRTMVMPILREYLNGELLWNASLHLRIEILSGLVNFDTMEMQLEPLGGLEKNSGTWEWSDWVPAQQYAMQPMRRTQYSWYSEIFGPSSGMPSVGTLNGMLHSAMAAPGGTSSGSNSWQYPPELAYRENYYGESEHFSEYTFWALTDTASVRKVESGVTYWWDEYPARWHDTFPAAKNFVRPAEEVYPDWWEVSGGTFNAWDIHPTETWETVGWSVAPTYLHCEFERYGMFTPAADWLPDRHHYTMMSGAIGSWPGHQVNEPASAIYPMPNPGPVGALTWTPVYWSDGMLSGYNATMVMPALPAGSPVTFIDHGVIDDLPAVYPGNPGVILGGQSTVWFKLLVQPPPVRWKQVIWVPDEEAAILEPGYYDNLPPGYFVPPNPLVTGAGDRVDVDFAGER